MGKDERTPEQKRADNLKDMITRGDKDPRTLSEGSKKVLAKRFGSSDSSSLDSGASSDGKSHGSSLDSGASSDGKSHGITYGSPEYVKRYGETGSPYDQIQAGKGPFFDSARAGIERLAITEKYNPSGLSDALSGSIEEYPERYAKASEKAVESRIQERNTGLFIQSAFGDMLQAGFFVTRGENNELFLSEKGRNLGKESIYDLEERAIWGNAFDFVFGKEGEVLVYPQGTRKAMKEGGFDEPLFLQQDGEEYLILQKEGKNTIRAASVNKITNSYNTPLELDIKKMIDLTGYEVRPDTSFDYSVKESGFEINASGLVKKEVPFVPLSSGNSGINPYGSEEILAPVKGVVLPGVNTNAPKVEYNAPWDKVAWGYSADVQSAPWYAQAPVDTPLTSFFKRDDAYEMAKPLRDFEKSTGLIVPNPIPGTDVKEIGLVSAVPYLFAGGIEATIKSGAAVGNIFHLGGDLLIREYGFNANREGAIFKIEPNPYTDYERRVAASELVASKNYLVFAPISAVFVSAGILGKTSSSQKAIQGEISHTTLLSTQVESDMIVKKYNLFTQTTFKPEANLFNLDKVASYKAESIMGKFVIPKLGFGDIMQGAVGKGEDLASGAKTLEFFAGSEKVVLKQIAETGPPALSSYAKVTLMGLNPYSMVKPQAPEQPQVKLRLAEPSQGIAFPISPIPIQPTPSGSGLVQFYHENPERIKGASPTDMLFPAQTLLRDMNLSSAFEIPQLSAAQERRIEALNEDIWQREAGRTKSERAQAVREMNKIGFGLRTGVSERVTPREMTGITTDFTFPIEMPRIGTGLKVGLGTGMKTKIKVPSVPTIRVIKLDGNLDGLFKQPPKMFQMKVKGGYSPSLAGADLGISEKKIKKAYLGFEVRGLRGKPRF